MPATTNRFFIAVAVAASSVSAAAQAEGFQEEWRVMGPAFAHHFSSDGEVTAPSTSTQECEDLYGNVPSPQPIVSPTPLPGLVFVGRDEHGNYIYMPLPPPSVRECKTVLVPGERKGWEGNNPALGLRYTQRFDGHSNTFLVNWVRDSYGTSSVMLAAGRMWPVLDVASVKVDAGVVGGLWYRSVLNRAEDGLVRRLVPFALPSVSITEAHTRLGVDLGFAPRLSFNGYVVNRTPTLMAQLNYLVRQTERDSAGLSLGASPSGRVTASYSSRF